MYLYMSNFPWLTMFTRTNGTNRNVYFNMDLLCLYTAFDRFMKFHFYFVLTIYVIILSSPIFALFVYALARREAQAKGRRPEAEGANMDLPLVPYHGTCKRIQSRIEFIYTLCLSLKNN